MISLRIKIFNFFLHFAFITLPLCVQSQIIVKQLDLKNIPNGIKDEGKIKSAFSWIDTLGVNIVTLSETGIHTSKKFKHENFSKDAELYANHFILKGNDTLQTWRVYDFISDCPVDIEAKFIKNSFQVTDLNQDGIGEIWIMYKTVCHGDVSPSDMKIIMYQGQQKYAIRGQNKVQITDKEFYGGKYKIDKAFANGPKVFLTFAKKLWDKNIIQLWID